ncbi:MAG: hypothetical protein ACFFB0_20755 [Promethearchaeota archaeon]
MENFDYDSYSNYSKNPNDFLIKPERFNEANFKKLCKLVDAFHLTEINIFNLLYEELCLNKNGVNLVGILDKIKYYPLTLSKSLKNLVKRNYIKLYLVNETKPKDIAVKFTKKGLDQIKLIRELFLQCKHCNRLYLYPVLENNNGADEDFCSINCRHKY